MRIYYSHSKTYRNSKEEKDDIRTLELLGYTVESPYDSKFSDLWQTEGLGFGKSLIEMCDDFAFRPLSNGSIGSGVGQELKWAIEMQKSIIEMPSVTLVIGHDLETRILSIEDTVTFFNTVGK